MNIRIKFQKYGVMKFIGHLDMMRYFQKAIRRAGIDIAYSGGYSRHQIMSFDAPLGVGVTSGGEYFDIEVNTSKSSQESIEALNQAMVEGISILEYKRLPDTARTSMSLVAAADYFVYEKPGYEPFFSSLEELQEKVQAFYEKQPEIIITKQTKKSQAAMDLKPFIYEMKAVKLKDMGLEDKGLKDAGLKDMGLKDKGLEDKSQPVDYGLFLKVCTGSSNNIKPELVLEALCRFCQLEDNLLRFQVHRLEVYAKSEEIPVKGEKERADYQKHLEQLKKTFAAEGKKFPEFLPLGALGEDISWETHC